MVTALPDPPSVYISTGAFAPSRVGLESRTIRDCASRHQCARQSRAGMNIDIKSTSIKWTSNGHPFAGRLLATGVGDSGKWAK